MNQTLPKLQLTDLLRQAEQKQQMIFGRKRIIERALRAMTRRLQPHLVLTGPAGSGKTAVIQGLLQTITQTTNLHLPAVPYLALSIPQLEQLTQDDHRRADGIRHIMTALQTLPPCVLVLDGVDTLLSLDTTAQLLTEIFTTIQTKPHIHLLLTMSTDSTALVSKAIPEISQYFEVIPLPPLKQASCTKILRQQAGSIAAHYHVTITKQTIEKVSEVAQTLRSEIALPQRALQLLDDVCAAGVVRQQSIITVEHVQYVVAQRTGIPVPNKTEQQQLKLKQLPQALMAHVRGQDLVVKAVAQTIQRGWLGLKDPRRPLGSFLFLGPSGVGKTELAKAVAREVYGSEKSLVRLDMSEFGESHMVQRLIGAPPGYVGYEAGGQLTNPIAQRPWSLILLDEIEKAHPTIFDIFLQVLDDGRLTDGQGQTVDFTKTIIMATSNLGLPEIIAGWEKEQAVTEQAFSKNIIIPLLLRHFRAEFINRFEGIQVFTPLAPALLEEIAYLELQKISQRLGRGKQQFTLAQPVLAAKIKQIYDPRLGARPLKRWLEQVCENSLAQELLAKTVV